MRLISCFARFRIRLTLFKCSKTKKPGSGMSLAGILEARSESKSLLKLIFQMTDSRLEREFLFK